VKVDFENDTLFFCNPLYYNILDVNFHKSVVGSVAISQLDMFVYSKCLNCC